MAEIVSNQIPLELRQNQGWVYWKSEQYPDEKKPRKIPYNPKTGHQAKVNEPETRDLLTNLWRVSRNSRLQESGL